MLVRSAEGLYWMGRYVERTEQLSRLLQLQVQALVDRPVPEIHFGWRRLYDAVGDPFLTGEFESDEPEEFALADAYTLTDNLTFERDNPNSVLSCLVAARENARQIRNCISGDMWECLNLAYLRVRDTSLKEVWAVSPESFLGGIVRDVHAFPGVARATMYRDRAWEFLSLGRHLERAQQLAGLLLAHFDAEPDDAGLQGSGRTSLLRAFRALETYQSKHGIEIRTEALLDLLLTDIRLPKSLRRSLKAVEESLARAAPAPRAAETASEQAAALSLRLTGDWNRESDARAALGEIARECQALHDGLAGAYFGIAVDGE